MKVGSVELLEISALNYVTASSVKYFCPKSLTHHRDTTFERVESVHGKLCLSLSSGGCSTALPALGTSQVARVKRGEAGPTLLAIALPKKCFDINQILICNMYMKTRHGFVILIGNMKTIEDAAL